ncbi:MAG: DUF711 family protein [Desulfurococcaceae archaeon]|jgi:uncharacterized protein (UPF0210 family)
MKNLVVRAITYFTGIVKNKDYLSTEFHNACRVLDYLESELKKRNIDVFTKRVSFTGLSAELAFELLDFTREDVLVSIGYGRLNPEEIIQLAENGLYVPLIYDNEPSVDNARLFSEIIHRASERDPTASTRISIGFHRADFQTPYFPDSSSSGIKSIGLSFIYPRCLIDYVKSGYSLNDAFIKVFDEIHGVANLVSQLSELPVYVDYSLSPWIDNSVVELYDLMNLSILEPGALYFTWILNNYINRYSNKELRTGFNEVMLPYAEDKLLLDYGARGLIRARDFLFYASTCVAGVDMIVVPEDINSLTLLIASGMALSAVKSKPMSFRAIPVQSKPGELIKLGKFGVVPVIPY